MQYPVGHNFICLNPKFYICNQQVTFLKSLAPVLRMKGRGRLQSFLPGPALSSSCSVAVTTPVKKSASTSQALHPPASLDKLDILISSRF